MCQLIKAYDYEDHWMHAADDNDTTTFNKGLVMQTIFYMLASINHGTNDRIPGDLRRHDVNVTSQ